MGGWVGAFMWNRQVKPVTLQAGSEFVTGARLTSKLLKFTPPSWLLTPGGGTGRNRPGFALWVSLKAVSAFFVPGRLVVFDVAFLVVACEPNQPAFGAPLLVSYCTPFTPRRFEINSQKRPVNGSESAGFFRSVVGQGRLLGGLLIGFPYGGACQHKRPYMCFPLVLKGHKMDCVRAVLGDHWPRKLSFFWFPGRNPEI